MKLGIDILIEKKLNLLSGRRVGLVAHPASRTADGEHASDALKAAGVNLCALFGPEHGYAGKGDAGETIHDSKHDGWDIPVYSLYGKTRKPTEAMLRDVDIIVVDLQDISVRCYTYIATLRNVLEAAAECATAVVVCDRPSPLAHCVDGPMLEASCASFVGSVPAPLVYGMTQGEAATWLRRACYPAVRLTVIPAEGLHRNARQPETITWMPPSPAIRSWACALCYPATVFTEALPSLGCERTTNMAFQVLTASWMEPDRVCAALGERGIEGVRFLPYQGGSEKGVRLEITDPLAFRPVRVGVYLLSVLRDLYGDADVWGHPETREAFFDQLAGTPALRESLRAGSSPAAIINDWTCSIDTFRKERELCLLYD